MAEQRTFFSSDHHFNHKNIIKYCERPFENIAEHDVKLIELWNQTVGPDDRVYYLGDLTLRKRAYEYLRLLNGTIYMLYNPWHHDEAWLTYYKKAMDRGEMPTTKTGLVHFVPPMIVLEGKDLGLEVPCIHLSHYPLFEWDRKHYGAWHLHGHSHGRCPGWIHMLDVGVDCWNYQPVSLEAVKEFFVRQDYLESLPER